MASLVLRNFGGMAPSANPKSMPEAGATYALNLDLRFGDFRPLPTPSVVATVAAGKTLYRFESGAGFITRTTEVNFVRGPITTDSTERTYYTGDGAPKVTDNTGAVRQLGVPAPAAAPTVVVNVVDEFSKADSAAALPAKQAQIVSLISTWCTTGYAGVADPVSAEFVATTDPTLYRFKVPGTLAAGVFTPTNPAHSALTSDLLGFHMETVGATTTGYVELTLRGMTLSFPAGLATDLTAITDPSDLSGVKKLLTSDQVNAITGALSDALAPADKVRDAQIVKITAFEQEFMALADSGSGASQALVAAVKAFYQYADVQTAINDGVNQAVVAISNYIATL